MVYVERKKSSSTTRANPHRSGDGGIIERDTGRVPNTAGGTAAVPREGRPPSMYQVQSMPNMRNQRPITKRVGRSEADYDSRARTRPPTGHGRGTVTTRAKKYELLLGLLQRRDLGLPEKDIGDAEEVEWVSDATLDKIVREEDNINQLGLE